MPKIVSKKILKPAVDERLSGELFDKIAGFAGYGFNASHATTYTLISYQSMWLKVNYPVEFYAAALTLMDEAKLPAVIGDAKRFGIAVDMPDINNSTDRFEIVTDTRLVIPFQRVKGISSKTAEAIMEARKAGHGAFVSKADFISRVEKRRCNVRHQEILDKIGAFARIEPGAGANDPSRIKDQVELIPGLITAHVPVMHNLHRDKISKQAIADLVDEYRAKHGMGAEQVDGLPVKPHFGRSARFMVISDAPNNEEDGTGVMGMSRANTAVLNAMKEAGLDLKDCYWTALIKRAKTGKQVSPEEIALYSGYLSREIEMLAPPIIVLLGSTTVRHFLAGFKGKASDVAGKIIYDKERDANIVIGFSPGEIYHAPEKQTNMNAVFASVAELIGE